MTRDEALRWKAAWAASARALDRDALAQPLPTCAEGFAMLEDLVAVAASQLGWPLLQTEFEVQEETRVRELWGRLRREAKARAESQRLRD